MPYILLRITFAFFKVVITILRQTLSNKTVFDLLNDNYCIIPIVLRAMFPETVGKLVIGIHDTLVRALHASDIVDYVIPHHASGLKPEGFG